VAKLYNGTLNQGWKKPRFLEKVFRLLGFLGFNVRSLKVTGHLFVILQAINHMIAALLCAAGCSGSMMTSHFFTFTVKMIRLNS
jgi:hypothetical protein